MTEYHPSTPPTPSPEMPNGPRWQVIIAGNVGALTWIVTHDPSLAIAATSLVLSAFQPMHPENRPPTEPEEAPKEQS